MFNDVENDRWSKTAIQTVVDAGLMVGYPDGTFQPGTVVTREQLAVVLAKQIYRDSVFEKTLLEKVLKSVVLISRPDMGMGTGWCYKVANGWAYIVTNAHVVGDFTSFTLIKEGGWPNASATLVAKATNVDAAIIKMSAGDDNPIEPLPIDTTYSIGQPVAVVGSPKGYSESVTVGIVSNISREGDTFQLDAPINPGNSGGPVINEAGYIVGMVVSKFVSVDTEGMAFAIKISKVLNWLKTII